MLVGVLISSPAAGPALILALAHSLTMSEAVDGQPLALLAAFRTCRMVPISEGTACTESPFSPGFTFLGDHLALVAP